MRCHAWPINNPGSNSSGSSCPPFTRQGCRASGACRSPAVSLPCLLPTISVFHSLASSQSAGGVSAKAAASLAHQTQKQFLCSSHTCSSFVYPLYAHSSYEKFWVCASLRTLPRGAYTKRQKEIERGCWWPGDGRRKETRESIPCEAHHPLGQAYLCRA